MLKNKQITLGFIPEMSLFEIIVIEFSSSKCDE